MTQSRRTMAGRPSGAGTLPTAGAAFQHGAGRESSGSAPRWPAPRGNAQPDTAPAPRRAATRSGPRGTRRPPGAPTVVAAAPEADGRRRRPPAASVAGAGADTTWSGAGWACLNDGRRLLPRTRARSKPTQIWSVRRRGRRRGGWRRQRPRSGHHSPALTLCERCVGQLGQSARRSSSTHRDPNAHTLCCAS